MSGPTQMLTVRDSYSPPLNQQELLIFTTKGARIRAVVVDQKVIRAFSESLAGEVQIHPYDLPHALTALPMTPKCLQSHYFTVSVLENGDHKLYMHPRIRGGGKDGDEEVNEQEDAIASALEKGTRKIVLQREIDFEIAQQFLRGGQSSQANWLVIPASIGLAGLIGAGAGAAVGGGGVLIASAAMGAGVGAVGGPLGLAVGALAGLFIGLITGGVIGACKYSNKVKAEKQSLEMRAELDKFIQAATRILSIHDVIKLKQLPEALKSEAFRARNLLSAEEAKNIEEALRKGRVNIRGGNIRAPQITNQSEGASGSSSRQQRASPQQEELHALVEKLDVQKLSTDLLKDMSDRSKLIRVPNKYEFVYSESDFSQAIAAFPMDAQVEVAFYVKFLLFWTATHANSSFIHRAALAESFQKVVGEYPRSKPYRDEAILALATIYMLDNENDRAIALLNEVPSGSHLYATAQNTLKKIQSLFND